MIRTLLRVAALALLLLPGAALAEPPKAGATFVFSGAPFHACRSRDDAVNLALTPSGPEYQNMLLGLNKIGRCGILRLEGPFTMGASIFAGPDGDRAYWAAEVKNAAGQSVWIIWGEPLEAKPSGWTI